MGKHSEDKKIKMKKKKRHIGGKIFLLILILLIAGGIYLAVQADKLGGGWPGLMAVFMGHNQKTAQELEELRVLILGESTGMTDTIIVASYNPKTQKASMLSIPRDTFTGSSTSRASSSNKINSLAQGGKTPEETLKAVNEITGLDVKYYVYVDTKALIKMVDVIGGIEFNVPIDMNYDDEGQNLAIHFKAGNQKLTGKQVQELVRFRHNNNGSTYSYEYGIEDYGRMHTQRDVIKELAKQSFTLKNIKEINNIIDIFKEYVKTNIDLNSIKDYIPYAMKMDMGSVVTEQLPGESKLINGIWFFLNDDEETEEVVDRLFLNPSVENETTENKINN